MAAGGAHHRARPPTTGNTQSAPIHSQRPICGRHTQWPGT
jgi:hypothetical protein